MKPKAYTIADFNRDFPTDDACLEYIKQERWPDGIHCQRCEAVTKHHRVRGRTAYACDRCGHHVYPLAGTIFEKSTTSPRHWFYAMYIMASTRCGISAKQLERETGVTYKTAWRMFNRIRSLLNDDDGQLGGVVEIDHTYIGGRRRGMGRGYIDNKAVVFGAVERKGRVKATHIDTIRSKVNTRLIRKHVMPSALVYTDEGREFARLGQRGYQHRRIYHDAKVYVRGDVHTNTIEGFWSLVKRGISGVYHAVSQKYLQDYLNEYAFRYNKRDSETPMFKAILDRASAPADG
jgi:transposase-like protein